MCLLAICLLWRNVYLGILPIFWWWCLLFCSWLYKLFVHFISSALVSCIICNIFSQSISCLLFVYGSLCYAKAFKFNKVTFIYFCFFFPIALGDWPRKTLVWFMSENVLPMFSSRSFMLSCLIFKSLSHLEFIFVNGVRVCSNFIDLQCCCF